MIFLNMAYNMFLFFLLKKIKTEVVEQNYWMGAEDYTKEGDWRWVSDLSKVQYSGWQSGEPNNWLGNEDCALFYLPHSLNWNDGRCNFKSGYICEKQHVRTINVFLSALFHHRIRLITEVFFYLIINTTGSISGLDCLSVFSSI